MSVLSEKYELLYGSSSDNVSLKNIVVSLRE